MAGTMMFGDSAHAKPLCSSSGGIRPHESDDWVLVLWITLNSYQGSSPATVPSGRILYDVELHFSLFSLTPWVPRGVRKKRGNGHYWWLVFRLQKCTSVVLLFLYILDSAKLVEWTFGTVGGVPINDMIILLSLGCWVWVFVSWFLCGVLYS